MTEKFVLVEHFSTINTIIRNTFQITQRIKFTAFDVSSKYVIFGVNSGGIYIFSRESCQFIKLIPSTHGPANLLVISDDEENLAVAVTTGLVIVLENFVDLNFQQQVFTEHEGSTVTALKWNGNDLYCGDTSGKVSVITIKNFLPKAIFQTPMACLMHLESSIVQLDTHSKFLLVSTLTRSLLCDTETERYRQIGKKTRDGRFGACFFNVIDSTEITSAPQNRGSFQTVGDNEQLSLTQFDENVKIYCARPGARLWQANFQANVIFTHQFRSSLNQKQTNIIHLDETPSSVLKITKFDDDVKVGEHFNFGKITRFLNKFILTFKDDGFYIFEPSSSALLFWSAHIKNIKDIKIINSFLYIWHKDHDISIISLLTIEELILNSLLKKQYRLCGQLCVEFEEDVHSLITTSKKIHLISDLESKLTNLDGELLDKLSPIINRLKDYSKTPTLEKFKNGIVSVNNPIEAVNLPETVENFQSDPPPIEKNTIKSKNDPLNLLFEQYKIYNIHKNVETANFIKLMESLNPNEKYELFKDFIIRHPKNEKCQSWCHDNYLKYFNTFDGDLNSDALNFACEAFLRINNFNNLTCKCNFPLPIAHENMPKYYEIGCQLMEKSDGYESFLKNVPYMQKFILDKIDDFKDIQLKLPLLIQYSDRKIIGNLSGKMTYDFWDDCTKLLLKLKNGFCLYCGENINTDGALDWKHFALLMIDSIKATNAVKLLQRYSNLLPKGELSEFFYQYCIFSTVSNIKSNQKFNEIFYNENVEEQFGISVGRYLNKKYMRSTGYDGGGTPIIKSPRELISNCDHCQLPLEIPVIEKIKKMNCGHNYHQLCFLYNKKQCPICDSVL